MSKHSPEQFQPPSTEQGRTEELNRLKTDLQDLSARVGKLNESGKKVGGLVTDISGMILSVENSSGELRRALKNANKFEKTRNAIVKRIEKIKLQLDGMGEGEEKEVRNKTEKIIITEGNGEDEGMSEAKINYSHAKKRMENIFEFMKKRGFAKEKYADLANYEELLGELDSLLYKDKDLVRFAEVYDVFMVNLKTLEDQVADEAKKWKNGDQPANTSNLDVEDAEFVNSVKKDLYLTDGNEVSSDSGVKEKKEGEKIKLADAEKQWEILEKIGVKLLKKEERKNTDSLVKRIRQILNLANEASDKNFSNEVDAQMVRFGFSFNELLSKLPENVREEYKNQMAGNKPSWEKKEELVPEETKTEISKENQGERLKQINEEYSSSIQLVNKLIAELSFPENKGKFTAQERDDIFEKRNKIPDLKSEIEKKVGILTGAEFVEEIQKIKDLAEEVVVLVRAIKEKSSTETKTEISKETEKQRWQKYENTDKAKEIGDLVNLLYDTKCTKEEKNSVNNNTRELNKKREEIEENLKKNSDEDFDKKLSELKKLVEKSLAYLSVIKDRSEPTAPEKKTGVSKEVYEKRSKIFSDIDSAAAEIDKLVKLVWDEKSTDEDKVVIKENIEEFVEKKQEIKLGLGTFTEEEFENKSKDLQNLAEIIINHLNEIDKSKLNQEEIDKRWEKIRVREELRNHLQDWSDVLLNEKNVKKVDKNEKEWGIIIEKVKRADEINREIISGGINDYSNEDFATKLQELNDLDQEALAGFKKINNTPESKGLFSRIKEGGKKLKDAIFNREVGKVVGKIAYDTVTSVTSVKIITDFVYGVTKGKGDLAEWWKNSKESVDVAYNNLIEAFEASRKNHVLKEGEKTVDQRLAEFNKKVDSANISPEIKKALLDKVFEISLKYQDADENAKKERSEEVKTVLDTYLHTKVSNLKVAKDFLNLGLTATGFSMLRGIMYAGFSVAERAIKAKKEFANQGEKEKKSELGFVAKDVIVNSAIETVNDLTGGLFSKEKLGVKKRTINFAKAVGTIMRGFGIYGVALSGSESTSQSIDKLLETMKEGNVLHTMGDNLLQNAEHTVQTYAKNAERIWHAVHGSEAAPVAAGLPTDSFKPSIVPPKISDTTTSYNPEQSHSVLPKAEVEIAPSHTVEIPTRFSVEHFAVEHKLSQEYADSLQSLVGKYSSLNNEESIKHILDASQVGAGVHSHHEFIGNIETLDAGGGERRQVIFEELLKQRGGETDAVQYLKDQNFSDQHLSHLPAKYVHDGKLDYEKFVKDYNANNTDKKLIAGLFGALQGRESTDLANAKLEVDAAVGKTGVDNHVHGKVNYFGVENKKPVLSGEGSVSVDQIAVNIEKNIETDTVQEAVPQKHIDIAAAEKKIYEDYHTITQQKADRENFNKMLDSLTDEKPQIQIPQGTKHNTYHIEKTLHTYNAKDLPLAESTTIPNAEKTEIVDVAGQKNEAVKNVSADNQSVKSDAEKTVSASAGSNSKEKKKYESVPETKTVENKTITNIDEFLKEKGSSREAFENYYHNLAIAATTEVGNKFDLTSDAEKFLHNNIISIEEIESNQNAVNKIIEAETLFKDNHAEGINLFKEITFRNEDADVKFIFSERDVKKFPIAIGQEAVKIWDTSTKKDIVMYIKKEEATLEIGEKDGKPALITKNTQTGEVEIATQKEILDRIHG